MAFPFFVVAFAITVLFGAATLVLGIISRPANRLSIVVWLIHPLAACALLLLFLNAQSPANPLFRFRFHLSQRALDEAAAAALSSKPPATPVWVGLFRIRRIDVDPFEIRFASDGCGVIDECGLLYRPAPMPTGRYKTKVKHLGGPWYHWHSVF